MDNTLGPDGKPWTTRSLAKATQEHGVGMSHATVGKIADGTNDNPRMKTIEDLAAALATSPGFFFSLYDVSDLPSVQMFGNPRIRELLTVMQRLTPADLADVEALVSARALAAGDPPERPLPPPAETPRRPGRRRMSEAARRAAKSLEP
jgi:transcriptional regulator with XRE-family HTH domain